MDREPLFRRKTSISYKTEEKTVLRGYNMSELAEEGYTFCDALFVLFQQRLPTENEEKMLEYETAEFLEHSMSPSAAGAFAVISGRPHLPAAVAAAVMTFGGAHGPGAALVICCTATLSEHGWRERPLKKWVRSWSMSTWMPESRLWAWDSHNTRTATQGRNRLISNTKSWG